MNRLYDRNAEEGIAACAAFSHTAALACTDRLTSHHFYDPRCWAIIEAALTIPNQQPAHGDPTDCWWREHAVAQAANIPFGTLQHWCQTTVHAWDIDGHLADRVIAAHNNRQQAQRLLVELEELGIGVVWKAAS